MKNSSSTPSEKTSLRWFLAVLAGLPFAALILGPRLRAQGILTPPGAPAPTMKTLDQVEPRIPISSLPFTIVAPGSYYITGNLTGVAGQQGIIISADNVTIDLGGFELAGPASGVVTSGIRTVSPHVNTSIRNGTIRGWLQHGIFAETVAVTEMKVENVRVFGCGGSGIVLGNNGTAVGCEVRANNTNGITGGNLCKIRACTAVDQVTGSGIFLGFQAVVTDSTVGNNGLVGIRTGNNSSVLGCSSANNADSGYLLGVTNTVTNCASASNGVFGFSVGQGTTLLNCASTGNGNHGFNTADTVTLQNCTATANTGNGFNASVGCTLTGCAAEINNGQAGIFTNSACTIIGCTLRANTNSGTLSGGIITGTECLVSQCMVSNTASTASTLTSTTGMGINAGSASTVERCTVQGCKGDGIRVNASCLVIGNTCDRNGDLTGDGAGIHSTGSENRIEGNSVTGNDRGIEISGSGSLIIKNTAASNTFDYVIAANNRFGPIINITGTGVAAQSVSSASASVSSVLASTDPWANFLY